MANNEYTINILNADQLYVEGKRIQQLDLGTLVEKAEGIGIGINNSFPKLIFDISGTDGFRLPAGTTSGSIGRPLSTLYDNISGFEGPYKLTGVIRFNKDIHKFEGWTGLNTNLGIGLNDNSWGSFVQEDNDHNRVKFSNDVNNVELLDFYIHTIKNNYTFIGNNLGNYDTTLNSGSGDWTNRSKGPPSYISLYGGENQESHINFHTSTMAKSQASGAALGVTQRMRITANGNIAIGDNFENATSRVTIKGADKFPNYSTTALNPFGNAFNGTTGYGQIRLVSNSSDSSHLDIGASSTVGSPGIMSRFSSYLQSQTGNSASPLLLQPTGGYIGIGEIDPEYKLDVNGDIRLGGTAAISKYNPKIVFSESAGGVEDIYLQYVGSEGSGSSGNRFRIGSGNSGWDSEALTVVGNGKIGMGRTNPYTKLHVKDNAAVLTLEGTTHSYMQFYRSGGSRTGWFGNGSNSSNMSWTNSESGGSIYLNTTNGLVYSNSTIQINWRSNASILNLGDAYNGIRADNGHGITIKTYGVSNGIHLERSTGRVGIGTSSPSYKLQVEGNGYFKDGLRVYGTTNNASGSDAVLYVGKNDSEDWGIMVDYYGLEYGLKLNGGGSHMISMYQNNTFMARFNSAGQLERGRPDAGYLVGSYNYKGSNSYETSPIYTIGTNYRPGYTSLGNMYGIGYTYSGNASFISSSWTYGNGWGMYVASDGDARIFLDGTRGDVNCTGTVYVGNWLRTRGSSGWYSQTYAGGWYMPNSSWVYSYNKPVYIQNYRSQYLSGSINYAQGNSYQTIYDSFYISSYWSGHHEYIEGFYRTSNRSYNVGLRSPYTIWCGSIAVNSDKRIKKDIEEIPDDISLKKVREIECVCYNYKDEEKNTEHKVVGFIAQQVKKHFPNAVSLQKEVIPNVYKDIIKYKVSICDENGNELDPKEVGKIDKTVKLPGKTLFYSDSSRDQDKHKFPFDCKCDLEDCYKYDADPTHYFKLTIIDDINFKKNVLHQFDCITAVSGKVFKKSVQAEPMSSDNKSFIIDIFPTHVLYYGEEVEDFHVLDKQRLFALNFSATQEIDKIQQKEKIKVNNLEKNYNNQKEKLDYTLEKTEEHTEKMNNLEKIQKESSDEINNLLEIINMKNEKIEKMENELNNLISKLRYKNLI